MFVKGKNFPAWILRREARSQCLVFFIRGDDRFHHGAAEAARLQRPHPLDGGAAGRADRVLEDGGMSPAVEQLCRSTLYRLLGAAQRQRAGQPAEYAAVGKRLGKKADKRAWPVRPPMDCRSG